MQQLLNHIQTYNKLSSEAINALTDAFEQVVFSKNDFLLKEGQTCRHLYFIKNGAVRGYYILE